MMNHWKKSLFGYDRKAVRELIDQLNTTHQKKKEQLRSELKWMESSLNGKIQNTTDQQESEHRGKEEDGDAFEDKAVRISQEDS